jgi:hypothetical protein
MVAMNGDEFVNYASKIADVIEKGIDEKVHEFV